MTSEVRSYLENSGLKKRLLFLYRKYKVHGEFEDFYHSYCVHILEGKGKKQLLEHYTIDFLRSELGRDIEPKKKLSGAIEFDDFMMPDRDFGENQVMCEQIIDRFMGSRRVILILCWKYGFSNKEVSYLFNVSESRICQILSELRKEFRHEYEGIC